LHGIHNPSAKNAPRRLNSFSVTRFPRNAFRRCQKIYKYARAQGRSRFVFTVSVQILAAFILAPRKIQIFQIPLSLNSTKLTFNSLSFLANFFNFHLEMLRKSNLQVVIVIRHLLNLQVTFKTY